MKRFALIVVTLASLLLTSCGLEDDRVPSRRFVVLSNGDAFAPILLNETTGQSWLLTDSGWRPIAMLKEGASTTDDDVRKEIDRRKAIYEVLNQSVEARKIVTAFKSGATGKDDARASLAAIVPQSLGSLPPGAEDGNWSPFSK